MAKSFFHPQILHTSKVLTDHGYELDHSNTHRKERRSENSPIKIIEEKATFKKPGQDVPQGVIEHIKATYHSHPDDKSLGVAHQDQVGINLERHESHHKICLHGCRIEPRAKK